MTSISPENQKLLQDVVVNGRFKSEDKALAEALRLLQSQLANGSEDHDLAAPGDWNEALRKWSRKPRTGNPTMDDSRDSIYEGRGE